MKHIFRTLHYRNYRLYFFGQGSSLVGTWMQQVAMSWLVYRLTGSPVMLGVIGFLGQVPGFFISPFAGVFSDRCSRRTILFWTQSLAMLQAFILATLVLSGQVQIWQVLILSIFLGIVLAIDAPARQAFVADVVEKKEDFGNAIALNSAMFNGARLIGPSIAGLMIAAVGEGICFLINGFSFGAVILALLKISIPQAKAKPDRPHIVQELMDGLQYIFHTPKIFTVLMLMGAVSLLSTPYMTLAPAFARDILHGTARTLGSLMTAAGFGAMTGSLYMASRRNVMTIRRVIPLATLMLGLAITVFALSRTLWISLPVLFIGGFFMIVIMASCNTLIQTLVADHMRGRVMSFYAMAFMGMMPFGSLAGGAAAGLVGVPSAVLLSGLLCIACAGSFALVFPAFWERARSRNTHASAPALPLAAGNMLTEGEKYSVKFSGYPHDRISEIQRQRVY